jgi:surface protein
MYDDPRGLADKVIEKLKTGKYEQVTGMLYEEVKTFVMGTSAERAECKYGPLCVWNVCALTNFRYACSPEVPETCFTSDLYWNTSSADDMSYAFAGNTEFKGDLSTWDVSKVANMAGMFLKAGIEDSGIGDWNTASLEKAESMFHEAGNLSRDLDLSGWTMGKCTNMTAMFQGSAIIDNGIGKWKVNDLAFTDFMLSDTHFKGAFKEGWPEKRQTLALRGFNRGTAPVKCSKLRQG